MQKAKALLFDFDGVLAKTMEDTFKAWEAVMQGYGVKIQPDDYYPLEGLKVHEVPGRLFGRYGREVPESPEAVVRKKEAYYLEHHHFELYPGVLDLLEEFQNRGIPMAVVTAALRERLERSCPPGFLERFSGVVSGRDACEGKPSPAPYLLGARKLNVSPEACIVVENAPLGIESAKKAGSYCIALATTLEPKYLTAADEVWGSFQDLRRSKRIGELL